MKHPNIEQYRNLYSKNPLSEALSTIEDVYGCEVSEQVSNLFDGVVTNRVLIVKEKRTTPDVPMTLCGNVTVDVVTLKTRDNVLGLGFDTIIYAGNISNEDKHWFDRLCRREKITPVTKELIKLDY